MEIEIQPGPARPRAPEAFANTRWSMVAGVQSESRAEARRSLGELCQSYWYPVFAYVRRCGHAPEVAYDLAQAFFGQLLEEMRQTRPQEYGRFRNFLLARLSRFLAGDRHELPPGEAMPELAPPQSLASLEQRQRREQAPEATPERAFQRGFALEVLARSLNRLRLEAKQGNRLRMFEQLEPFLTSEPEPGQYAAIASLLGARPLAIVVAVKRLRQRFRELVDEELSQTVASVSDMEAERGALLAILGDAQ